MAAMFGCSAMLWRCYGGVWRCYGSVRRCYGGVMAVLWRCYGGVRRDYGGTWMLWRCSAMIMAGPGRRPEGRALPHPWEGPSAG